jgi:Uma2 family endonuclease
MSALATAPSKTPRHAFTVEEVMALQAQGFFRDNKRIALHEGDIVERMPDGDKHIKGVIRIMRVLARLLGDSDVFACQSTLRFSRRNAPSPDFYVLIGGEPEGDVAPERVALVIEVADTSLAEDLSDTAERYVRAGVAEYWVVDVIGRAIFIHRDPQDGRYPPPVRLEAGEAAICRAMPQIAFSVDDLGI